MNARLRSTAFLFGAMSVAVFAAPAAAQGVRPFGLQTVIIEPPSGVATPASLIEVGLAGVANDSLTPTQATLVMTGPGTIEVLLTTPAAAATQVPTPWMTDPNIPFVFPPFVPAPAPIQLAPGSYDFYVRGLVAYGTPNEREVGFQLAVEDYVVVPEPPAALLAIAALVALGWTGRRPFTA
jgi:hypothetical protein